MPLRRDRLLNKQHCHYMQNLSIAGPSPKKPNLILAIANQKGGVGKTTICTTLSNKLSSQGYPILVVDCDGQQSIYKRRTLDMQNNPDAVPLYNVQPFDISTQEYAEQLMLNAREVPGTVIIDAPGSLSQNGIIPILRDSDIIICPLQFEKATCVSTMDFIKITKLIRSREGKPDPKFIFIFNRYNKGWGTKAELKIWSDFEASLKDYGIVAPKIPNAAEMERYNTIGNNPKQDNILSKAYNFVIEELKPRLFV